MRCQLVILYEGGWDWLKDAWAPASMRGEFQKFDLEFRGKITKKGNFGRDGVCRYKIEVLEMFSAHLLNADNALLLRNSDKPEPSADELIRPSKESAQTDPHTLLRPDSSEDDR